jgi:hypothetical protein
MPRDNFSMPVKRELALRAAHFCSNPFCLKLTAGPRSGTERGLGTGHAAHICGASANGPRFVEVRFQGYSRSLELLRSNRAEPGLASQIIALFEDRRLFWARFDAEFPERVRLSLENLRHDLTRACGDSQNGLDAIHTGEWTEIF